VRLTPAHLPSGITLSLIEGEPGADFTDLGGIKRVKSAPSLLVHSPHDAALTTAPREQGESRVSCR
jgi:hypothetical protein